MFHKIDQMFSKVISFIVSLFVHRQPIHATGPNTLAELLIQFDQPAKEKTTSEIIRDSQIRETIAALEVDMLKMEPSLKFNGHQCWYNSEGSKFYDWMPCSLRPETLYCCYGKN